MDIEYKLALSVLLSWLTTVSLQGMVENQNEAILSSVYITSRCYIFQVLQNVAYNGSVDWWALGVLIYEMLVGRVSFKNTHMHWNFSK